MNRISLLLSLLIVSSLTITICLAKGYQGVLKDPLVLGAWLYKSTCTRCHGSYESSRVGMEFEDRDELIEALSGEGCEVDWSRVGGGPFGRKELEGLAEFIQKWESLEEKPVLPELPELLVEKVEKIPAPVEPAKSIASPMQQEQVLADELVHLLASNNVARGG